LLTIQPTVQLCRLTIAMLTVFFGFLIDNFLKVA
jgi:hypothetical protein